MACEKNSKIPDPIHPLSNDLSPYHSHAFLRSKYRLAHSRINAYRNSTAYYLARTLDKKGEVMAAANELSQLKTSLSIHRLSAYAMS